MRRGNYWHWPGYVIIKVKGRRLERFINAAAHAGVVLRHVERLTADMLVTRVSAAGFRRLRRLAGRQEWRMTILKRVGLPFFLHKLARRKALIAGGLLALAIIYVLSSMVWFVEVKGALTVPGERLLAVAAQHGLYPGAWKRAFSSGEVERELLLTFDNLSWAYVETRGTLAVIHVAEKVFPDPELTLPGDIVALYDGMIVEIFVLRGIPVVAKGDTVRAGEVLISGLLPPQHPLHAEKIAKGEPPYLRAEGVVRALVWHEGRAEAALTERSEEPTGRRHRQIRLTVGSRDFFLGGTPEFTDYKQKVKRWQPSLGRFTLPLVLSITWSEEIKLHRQPVDEQTAYRLAEAAAWEQVQARLQPGAELQCPPKIEVERLSVGDIEVLQVKIMVEAIENIRSFQPHVTAAAAGADYYRPALGSLTGKMPIPGP
ncbi:MAG TPA: sporulation protein YqfD [Firmicutes bacterium]|nr:sporulation protein YqfD [Bacillota bacterium]